MKDIQTIARPYAKALFELALEHQTLKQWSDALALLCLTINDGQMQKLIGHPEVTESMLVDILLDVLNKHPENHPHQALVKQALEVMSDHHRLAVIPEVYRQFEQLTSEHAKMCSGTVFTSVSLDEQQLQRLAAGLQKKLNKTVHLTQVVQPTLLGGARVQIGDMVIDGTLRGRLERLYQSLMA